MVANCNFLQEKKTGRLSNFSKKFQLERILHCCTHRSGGRSLAQRGFDNIQTITSSLPFDFLLLLYFSLRPMSRGSKHVRIPVYTLGGFRGRQVGLVPYSLLCGLYIQGGPFDRSYRRRDYNIPYGLSTDTVTFDHPYQ